MSPKYLWREPVGPEGARVVAIERTPGRFYLGHYERGASGLRLKALPGAVTTREQALAAALAFSAQLVVGGQAAAQQRAGAPVTVGALLARYAADVSAHKKAPQPAEDARRAALWAAFLGPDRPAASVKKADLERFARERRAGRIRVTVRTLVRGDVRDVPMRLAPHPGETTIGADVIFLQSVYNWAVDAAELLDRSPLARWTKRPRTQRPRRPVATYDRYLAVRAHAPTPRFAAFLDVIEGTGWRVSAVCRLTGRSVDRTATPTAPFGSLYKDPAHDKRGQGGWVPMPAGVRAAVDALGVVGDAYLFPSPRDDRRPWTRWHARDLLERAERAAGVGGLTGGDFHPYRRAWAMARKHLPAADVMAAGAWRDARTLALYQQDDAAGVARVALDATKLRDLPNEGGK